VKLIVSHAGAFLPFIAGRMDICYENMVAVRENVSALPSELLREVYYDSVTFRLDALQMCINTGGPDKVLYGSDYPHNIGDMRGCLSRVDALPFAQRKAIRGTNAQNLFNL
jgi:aminocarboxymuconate-semialdehyde decarboxylase